MIVTWRRAGLFQFNPCILGLVHFRCGRCRHWSPGSGAGGACSEGREHHHGHVFLGAMGDGRICGMWLKRGQGTRDKGQGKSRRENLCQCSLLYLAHTSCMQAGAGANNTLPKPTSQLKRIILRKIFLVLCISQVVVTYWIHTSLHR